MNPQAYNEYYKAIIEHSGTEEIAASFLRAYEELTAKVDDATSQGKGYDLHKVCSLEEMGLTEKWPTYAVFRLQPPYMEGAKRWRTGSGKSTLAR